jgi:hypothetical protein
MWSYDGNGSVLIWVSRQLLTHSSGMAYDSMSPDLQKYRLSQGLPPIAPRTGQTLVQLLLSLILNDISLTRQVFCIGRSDSGAVAV